MVVNGILNDGHKNTQGKRSMFKQLCDSEIVYSGFNSHMSTGP